MVLNKNNIVSFEEEIDLKNIQSFLTRNKNIISKSAILFFILASIFSLTRKKIWEGEFQIVLSTENKGFSFPGSPKLLEGVNLLNGIIPDNNSLKTEVGILQSPSILLPVFQSVQDSNKEGKNKSSLTYKTWKKQLKVKLKKETSILDITYKDKNKENILPVLKKISNEYQLYSSKGKKKGLRLAKNFLEEQIKIYTQKSKESLREAQKFGTEQNLLVLPIPQKSNSTMIAESPSRNNNKNLSELGLRNTDIEAARVLAVNEIKTIEGKIEKINSMNIDEGLSQYISYTIPFMASLGYPQKIFEINQTIIDNKARYQENDPTLKRLIDEKNNYLIMLKESALGYLNAQKANLEQVKEITKRPKGVYLKYKELIRKAFRDESTLIEMENNYRMVSLEEARTDDPWELISEPNLKIKPIAPLKRRYAIMGLIGGLFLGTAFAITKEKFSDLVYDENILEKNFLTPVITTYDPELDQLYKNNSNLNIENFLNIRADKINLLPTKNINKEFLDKLVDIIFKYRKKIDKSFTKEKIYINKNLSTINKEDSNILITNTNKITYEEMINLKKAINFYNLKFGGIILEHN